MYTLVGSRALDKRCPGLIAPKRLAAADYDYFTALDVGTMQHNPGERADVLWDARLGAWNWGHTATLDELYTIKISHMAWEPNRSEKLWDKHFADCIFMQRKGAVFIRDLYDILLPIWKEKYNKKSEPNLTKNKADFFKDAVPRKYDHDSLHESVAYNLQPRYVWALKSGSEVDVDWNRFLILPLYAQLEMIREEIYVTALERLIIPADYNYNAREAYHWALRRCCTSLFKNDWSLFIILHLDELRKPDCDYVKRHLDNRSLLVKL